MCGLYMCIAFWMTWNFLKSLVRSWLRSAIFNLCYLMARVNFLVRFCDTPNKYIFCWSDQKNGILLIHLHWTATVVSVVDVLYWRSEGKGVSAPDEQSGVACCGSPGGAPGEIVGLDERESTARAVLVFCVLWTRETRVLVFSYVILRRNFQGREGR